MSASIPCASRARRVSSGYSVLTRRRPGPIGHGGGQLGQRVRRRVGADGEHDPGRVGGVLRVGELAERDDLAPPLLDAVAPGDAEVEEAVGHVDRDLLRPQDPHLVDAGVVDGGAVGHVRGAVDGEVGVLEQLHGGAFERALGQDEAEHGGRSSQTRQPWPGLRAAEPYRAIRASWARAAALRRPQLPASCSGSTCPCPTRTVTRWPA